MRNLQLPPFSFLGGGVPLDHRLPCAKTGGFDYLVLPAFRHSNNNNDFFTNMSPSPAGYCKAVSVMAPLLKEAVNILRWLRIFTSAQIVSSL